MKQFPLSVIPTYDIHGQEQGFMDEVRMEFFDVGEADFPDGPVQPDMCPCLVIWDGKDDDGTAGIPCCALVGIIPIGEGVAKVLRRLNDGDIYERMR